MKTRAVVYTYGFFLFICGEVVQADWGLDYPDIMIVKNAVTDCWDQDLKFSCIADKAAVAMERAIHWDIPIFDGITFKRDEEKLENITLERSYNEGNRLASVISQFLNTHTLTLDLTEPRGLVEFGQYKDGRRKVSKRERRYAQYALMVLLGILGLTAPVILKTLALIAGKALISSKIALIMLGSVALKKIFQADNHSPVKVHTHTIPIHEDDHDRYMNAAEYSYARSL